MRKTSSSPGFSTEESVADRGRRPGLEADPFGNPFTVTAVLSFSDFWSAVGSVSERSLLGFSAKCILSFLVKILVSFSGGAVLVREILEE